MSPHSLVLETGDFLRLVDQSQEGETCLWSYQAGCPSALRPSFCKVQMVRLLSTLKGHGKKKKGMSLLSSFVT